MPPPRLDRAAPRAGHARGGRDLADVLGVVPQQPPTALHADLEHAPRVDAEVLGRRHVDEAPVDAARQAGVRLRDHGQAGAEHARDHLVDAGGTVRAVHADRVRAPRRASFCAICSGPVPSAIVPNGSNETERDDRHRAAAASQRASIATRISSGWRNVSSSEHVDAGVEQRARLLAERGAHALALSRRSASSSVSPVGPIAPPT